MTFSISVKRQCGLGYLQHEPSKPGGIAATGLPFSACHPASLGTGPATSISGSRRVWLGLPNPAGDEGEPAGRRAWQRTPRSKR